jgi:cell division protein FtsX
MAMRSPKRRVFVVSDFIPVNPEPFERRAQLESTQRTESLTEEIRDMTADLRDMTRTIRRLTWAVVALTVSVVGLTIANVVLVANQ